ncbi:MAG: hypothetical protein AAFY41_14915, partial [Bacteroidota bacterium]
FTESTLIQFIASANDIQDGNLSSNILWYSQIDGQIGNGANISTTLSTGTHTIQATVIDSDGLNTDTSFQLFISSDPPVPLISSPQDNDTYNYQDTVYLIGSAQDIQDGPIPSHNLNWDSDLQGYLGTGDSLAIHTLSPGDHQISLIATDSDGNDSMISVQNVNINAGQPISSILSPADGDTLFAGISSNFIGEGNDQQDGLLRGASLIWSSDKQGQIGIGDSLSISNLLPGWHIIRLTAIDSDGLSSFDEINVYVKSPQAPTISIIRPGNGSSFTNGFGVYLQAYAVDDEQGVLPDSIISWVSDIDGSLGIGNPLSNQILSPGFHVVSASVSDNQGLSSSASVNIEIRQQAPFVLITQPVDGEVFSSSDSIIFSANVFDYEDGNLPTGSISWESNIEGIIGSGENLTVDSLSPGLHTV